MNLNLRGFGVLGFWGFGGVDDLKKTEMDKTLRNGLIMSEMDPLNQKWLDFEI